jgi:hypothetical protein
MQLPKRSPNLNGYMERFMRSIKEECLRKLILFGESSLRNAVTEYLEHYHGERNHQGLDRFEKLPLSSHAADQLKSAIEVWHHQ